MSVCKIEVYWDDQDKHYTGWAYRAYDHLGRLVDSQPADGHIVDNVAEILADVAKDCHIDLTSGETTIAADGMAAEWEYRAPSKCEVCGGTSTCPGYTPYADSPEQVGLPADWTPPLRRTGVGGHRTLDPAKMPKGLEYEVVGSAQAARIEAHGGKTWWAGQCLYLAIPKRQDARLDAMLAEIKAGQLEMHDDMPTFGGIEPAGRCPRDKWPPST